VLSIMAVVAFGHYFMSGTDNNTSSLKKISAVIKPTKSSLEGNINEISSEISLDISVPVNNSVVNSAAIQIIGKTAANAEVFVNEVETSADSTGNFFVNINLNEGENNLFIVVNDSHGNYAESELTIYLESTD